MVKKHSVRPYFLGVTYGGVFGRLTSHNDILGSYVDIILQSSNFVGLMDSEGPMCMRLYLDMALFQRFQESVNGEWFGWFQKAKRTLVRLLQGMRSVLLLEFLSSFISMSLPRPFYLLGGMKYFERISTQLQMMNLCSLDVSCTMFFGSHTLSLRALVSWRCCYWFIGCFFLHQPTRSSMQVKSLGCIYILFCKFVAKTYDLPATLWDDFKESWKTWQE